MASRWPSKGRLSMSDCATAITRTYCKEKKINLIYSVCQSAVSVFAPMQNCVTAHIGPKGNRTSQVTKSTFALWGAQHEAAALHESFAALKLLQIRQTAQTGPASLGF